MIRPSTTSWSVEQLSRASGAVMAISAGVRRNPLARGQRWPSASIGPPQNGHGAPAGGDDRLGAGRERPRHRGGHPHQQHLLGLGLLDRQVDQLLLGGLDRELHLDLDDREHLDHDPLVARRPRTA